MQNGSHWLTRQMNQYLLHFAANSIGAFPPDSLNSQVMMIGKLKITSVTGRLGSIDGAAALAELSHCGRPGPNS